ncbi:MAG: hypothetical protein EOO08_10345 [Chitinophagaceae bacterium]|nr:MAG: hypothetical protein EOO08_10345 [Chitinophagaceae bacterium]
MNPSVQRKSGLALLSLLAILLSPLSLLAQQAPTSLKYPTPNVYIVNASSVFLSPTVSGNVASYSISPGLPSGITLNTNTGVISGTPTVASPATSYTVTATNASGSTNATLSIQATTSYFDNNNAQISFSTATQITGTNGGRTVGDRMLFTNVATLSGTQIDCIVTTTSMTNVTTYDTYDQAAVSGANFNSNDPKFFSPQFTFNAAASAATPAQVRFDFQFILGNSYNAGTNPNGTAVILQNVTLNSYDVDGNGTAGSNQFNLFGGFNTYQLSGTPASTIGVSYDATSRLTKFRSNVPDNNTTVIADETQIRLNFSNVSNFPVIVGAEEGGQAFFFLDFSASNAFTTPVTVTAPSIDLGTSLTGVNNETSGCAASQSFTSGTTNAATPTGNTFTSLTVSVPTADILNGSSELLLVNGATGTGASNALNADFASRSLTLGGINYNVVATSTGGIRTLTFTRASGTFQQTNVEALLDAFRYSNGANPATNGVRTFTVNAFNATMKSPDAIFKATVSCVSISGNIFHDANGLTDATVNANGSPTVTANFAYAVLVNQSSGLSIASQGIAAGGAYSFGTVDTGSYFIYIRNAPVTNGTAISSSTYPTSAGGGVYKSVGENFGSDAGNDGLTDGKIVIKVGSTSVANANFGIEIPPTTTSTTINNVANPGGYNNYTVPVSGGFTYADEDGTVQSITITSFPTGANYIRLNGTIYTNGGTCPPQSSCTAWPGTVIVPAANVSAIAVDPSAVGAASVVIPFRATDNGAPTDINGSPNSVTINFIAQAVPITVSGNVWDDVNANAVKDAPEQFTNVASAGQTLYALLVQTTNTYSGAPTVYASTAVAANATSYTFSNVPSGNDYEVRLASLAAQPSDGVALSTITQALATGWTGVSYSNNGSLTTSLNTTAPVITLGTVAASKPNVNFGIDALPTAVNAGTSTQVNPGGTNSAVVPTTNFSGTDAVDLSSTGSIAYIRITAFPNANATSITITGASTPGGAITTNTYNPGNFPAGGVYVAAAANGNLASSGLVTVDPVNGAVVVAIPYKVVDAARIESSNTTNATISFTDLSISGSVYDDVNGGTIDGSLISNAGGQLYVNLVNTSGNTVVASKAVTSGAFSFTTADGLQNNVGTYKLVLASSAAATTAGLPTTAWVNTAEGTSSTSGDGTGDGTFTFGGNVAANATIDFGIDALPFATALTTATSQVNPGGTNTITIPAGTFSGNDAGDLSGGIISYVHITAFPTNATGISFVAGALTAGGATSAVSYTSGTFPGGGVYVATNSSGNPSSAINVDPVNGAVNVDLTYRTVDNAGKESLATGTARQPLTDLSISGSVYDDVDGGTINGTLISNAGGQLYVNLVNTSGNTVVASKAVTSGVYSFTSADGLQNSISTYQLVLTNSAVATGSTLPSAAWTYTAEGLSGTTGDGAANGVYAFGGTVTSNAVIDFGIDALPTVTALNTAAGVTNPGGTNTITIPAATFTGADAGDLAGGQVKYIHITSFPTNTTTINFAAGALTAGGATGALSYTSGTFPSGGVYVAANTSGNPTSTISVDPANGAVNVDISYKTVDNAGKESAATGIARQPLTDVTISGSVYNDTNGGTINGTLISSAGGQLYVNLVNSATNTLVASKAVTGGTFSFSTADGLQTNLSTYSLVITNNAAATTSILPSTAWTYTAEGISGGSGDGGANGAYAFGGNVTANVAIDFGLDALPTVVALTTATGQSNPGGTNTITVPATTFTGTDADAINGGTISYIHITSFPSNATSITLTGSTTIGGAVSTTSYTSGTFPAGGIYVATNGSGNPASNVLIDPVNGAVNVDISYRTVDNAGKESLAIGVARQPLSDITISGDVFDDPDGGIINGTLRSNAGGQLYVNLVNNGVLVASKAVSGAGSYSFSTADGLQSNIATYSLVLTNSAVATTSVLPSASFTYTAEGIANGTGDGTPNGTYTFGGNVTANTAIDFGIDALPTVTALNTASSQPNPGGTNSIVVPAGTFSGADAGDLSGGQIEYIHITGFPSNATSISFAAGATTLGGATSSVTYTSGTFPVGGVYVATNAAGNPTSDISIDPANGSVNADISYKTVDNAGKESTATGTARQPFSDLVISGTVYDDANGGIINGTAISNAGGQLYVNLVNSATNTVVASRTLTNGTYSFTTADGVQNDVATYAVVLANSASATSPELPAPSAWVNTAEGLSGTTGDVNVNGRYAFGEAVTASQVIDFGIDALPTSASTTAVSQVNPGGTATVTIPASTFVASDAGDLSGGQVNYIHIVSFPTNTTMVNFANAATSLNGTYGAQSYTSATFPAGGVFVATNTSGNPTSAITLDPVNGAVNVDFSFTAIDNAGQEGTVTGVARQPLSDLSISGSVYDDINEGTINGDLISNAGGQLYVNLVNTAGNTVVASQAVTGGTYSFTTADGLRNDITTYQLVLTSSAVATSATLPTTGWVYIAEGVTNTSGDGAVNGTYGFGGAVTTSAVIDFAIEALPVPATLTVATAQVNPGGTATVTIPASTFVASDANDLSGGAVSYIHITSFPTNATTVNFASAATSVNGTYGPLSYTSGTFPAGGVYVATNAGGNPVSAITVDPVNGAVDVDFTFTAIDNSSKESVSSGIARQPFSDLTISGTLYDDANGSKDNSINGTATGTPAATQMYANLVNTGTNTVVASQAIAAGGTYSFGSANGVQTGVGYAVVLSTTNGTTTASTPSGWVNTAEGRVAAGDGTPNGIDTIGTITTSQVVNFGVNGIPTATSSTITAQADPGGTTLVTIPSASFPGTDPDTNGEIAYVHLTAYPSNATSITAYSATTINGTPTVVSYTAGTFPAGGIYIPTDGPGYLLPVDALKIDPAPGATQAQFPYTVIDIAGYESNGATTTVPFVTNAISGTVYNDFNALLDAIINGVGVNLGGQLYVNAVAGGVVVGSGTVNANGTYVIGGLPANTYDLVLTTANNSITPALPAGWAFTGEGLVPAGDGTVNGTISVNLSGSGVANADFGIDARPIANNVTATAQVNPGGTNNIIIPATTFSGADADAANGGEIEYVHITAFPTNATSITVTGALTAGGAVSTNTYNAGNFPAGGIYIATEDNGNLLNANAVQVDPVNGAVTISISFKVIDNAGQESTNTATAAQPLSDLAISGTVYDDVNGGIMNGTEISNAGGQLYVNLVSGGNTVVASKLLTDGTFSFTTANGVQSNVGTYTLVLTSGAAATSATLPGAAWTYTAEGISGTTGDGTADGSYAFGGNVTSSQVIDFGVDALPTAQDNTAVSQSNPGGTNNATIPATTFSGTDAVDLAGGAISYVHITAFPTNAASITVIGSTTIGGAVSTTTYTSGSFPGGGVYVATLANGNLATANAVQVDPIDGAVTVDITYTVVDNAGVSSATSATASQPFADILITGTVYNDVNAGIIDGTPISTAGGQLYVNLVNTTNNTVVASKLLTDGTFSFGTADGLDNSVTTYHLILTVAAGSTTPLLPSAAWVNTGEGISGTSGGPIVDGRYVFAGTISSSAVIDFGIDALPVPALITTAVSQANPGATNTVTIPASTFVASDATDLSGGQVDYIHILSFPTNTTTVNFANAATSVNGTYGAVSYTAGTFPAGGVYVATNVNGNPTSAITIDAVDGAVNVDFTFHAIDNAGKESNFTGTARQPLSDLLLTGTVYDDVDAGTIDGTPISGAGGQLYVNLVNTAGNSVVASKQLTNGTFSFGTADGLRSDVATYKLVLTTGAAATSAALPTAGWVNTAEGITNSTGDGVIDGSYTFGGVIAANTTIDFGVDARPIAVPLTVATSKVNPGGNIFIPIANGIPLGSDPVDVAGGQVIRIHVIAFPSNINAVRVFASEIVNGTLVDTTYNATTWPAGGIYVATDASGATLDSFYVDPVNGADTVRIQFRSIDQAWVESANVGIGKIPFSDLTISGNVYNDVNGNLDGIVNGTLISNAGGQLYVNLVNGNTNTVVSSKVVTGGAFSFGTADGLQSDNASYRVILAASPAATTQGLPAPLVWVNTGEGPTGAPDGLANGRYTLSTMVATSMTVDFGIDARPVPATLITATSQQNPGGTNTVTIPANTFSASDATDLSGGQVDHIHITSFPTNATTVNFASAASSVSGSYGAVSYTAASFPAGGVFLATNASGEPVAAITVDPVGGAVNVDFTYTALDNANVESNTSGVARQPLTDFTISGTVYDDVTAGIIDGTAISSAGGQLYVNLVNTANNSVVASKALSNGTFSFGTADGVSNSISTYQLVLTTSASGTSAALPTTGWVNIAEGVSGTTGDGAINGTYTFGGNVTSDVVIDFAIEALPVPAASITATPQVNPGGTNTVTIPANTFSASDATDLNGGAVSYIHITAFPTNATTIQFASGATTPGGAAGPLSYTSGTFPAGGVYVATNATGNPSSAISVDPTDGAVTVNITYTAIDNTNQESITSGIASQPLTDLLLTGNVYDDVDGGTINGTLISNAGGQLYVNLVNTSNNTVVASKAISNGAFSFSTADGLRNDVTTYKLVLANSAVATTGTLPAAWTSTAEGIPASSGDGSADGAYTFGGAIASNTAIDFGIDARPVPASLSTAVSQTNPGGTTTVTVPASTFVAADETDISGGTVNYIHITSFPANATTVNFASAATTVNGSYGVLSFTSATFPAGGVYLVTNTSGNPVSAITVDPVDGAVNVDFSYTAIDNAGVESSTTGIARQPLSDLTITGTIYDDVNGSVMNGTPISNAGGQLYVNLVNTNTNTVVSSKVVTGGTYSFGTADGLQNDVANYRIVLAANNAALVQGLPDAINWVNTGEGISGTSGDAVPNGRYAITGLITGSLVIDFGIDARPTADDNTAASQVNPGATNLVTVPATTFSGADATDLSGGIVRHVHITAFPTNATSVTLTGALTAGGAVSTNNYTAANFPAGGIYIATAANGNLSNGSAVQADPVDGALTVVFSYRTIDNANAESVATATASQPLSDLTLSGTVYDDVNAGTIDGTPISNAGGQLYVNLVSGGNTVVASKLLTDGTFSFGTADGVRSDVAGYTLVLTTGAAATSAALPTTGWVNTAEGISGTTGDGAANGTYTFGGNVTTAQVIDFGIDARPVPAALTVAGTQPNPGSINTVTVPASTFVASDATDLSGGVVSFIHIASFPTNTTTVSFANAATTVNGSYGALSYTSGTFPAGGVFIATNNAGNPTSAITVDPVDGAVNVDFTFTAIDNAGVESNTPGIARQPLSDLTISGVVYDDPTGGIINGTPISNAGGQLYVNLVNTAGNTVVASQLLTDGTYSFGTANGVRSDVTTYQLVLTTGAAATTAALPTAAWVNTAEGIAGSAGDGGTPGAYTFGGAVTSSQQIDFGIDALPSAANNTAVSQVNPGGTSNATVPAATFSGTDAVDVSGGIINYVHITSFPTNATSITVLSALNPGDAETVTTYTSATFPAGGIYLLTSDNGNLLDANAYQVDPINGAVTVVTTYTVIDNAGRESATSATASQPFSTLTITGTLFDDYNGITDNLLNGTTTRGGGLYVNAVDAGNSVVASAQVASDGSYSLNGLGAGTYSLVLTTSAGSATAALNSGWVTIGEGNGTTFDGVANGALSATLSATSLTNYNFAIEQPAIADAKVYSFITTTSPAVTPVTEQSTSNASVTYSARINLSGMASSGSTPGALTGLDNDGNAGSAITVAPQTPGYTLVIDPASYTATRNGAPWADGIMLEYNGIQLQAGGCQGGNVGNGSCSYFNSSTGKWEIPAYDLAQLKILVKNGTSDFSFEYAWKDAAGIAGTPALYQIVFGAPLPVHLITFTGEKRGSNAWLNWTADNEQNFRGYGVERSTDGRNFAQVGFVNGRGLAAVQRYNYTDDLGGINAPRVYYRLKQLDLNGAFEYSNVVTLNLGAQGIEPGVTLLTNPVRSQVRVQVRTAAATNAGFVLVDAGGRVVYRKQQALPGGTTALSLDVPALLTSGVYYLITEFDGNRFSNKVLVDR